MLSQYDKIGNRGHCCLLRNTEKMRKAYRYESDSIVTHRDAFSSELAYCFDEQMAFGRYCKESGVKTCENFTFFDVSCNHDDYRVSAYEAGLFEYNAHNVFLYDGGLLYLLWVKKETHVMQRKEILYAHFQKRAMQVNINEAEYDKFLVYKDSFNFYKKDLNAEDIKQCDPKSIKKTLWLNIMWKKIKAEILHLGGVKFYKYE